MKNYETLQEYHLYQDARIKIAAAESAVQNARIKFGEAEDALAAAICKFKIGQKVKVKHKDGIAIICDQRCRGSWSNEIEPHYVLRKIKKNGEPSQFKVNHGWAIKESDLELV